LVAAKAKSPIQTTRAGQTAIAIDANYYNHEVGWLGFLVDSGIFLSNIVLSVVYHRQLVRNTIASNQLIGGYAGK
jgi:hypothetical protein